MLKFRLVKRSSIVALILFAAAPAHAAFVPLADVPGFLTTLTTGPDPQVSVATSDPSDAEVSTLCQLIAGEDQAVIPRDIGRLQREVLNDRIVFSASGMTCRGTAYTGLSGVYLPAAIAFSFDPAVPRPTAGVTATATFNDPGSRATIPGEWAIRAPSGRHIIRGAHNQSSVSFGMPSGGRPVSVQRNVSSSHTGSAVITEASRTILLYPDFRTVSIASGQAPVDEGTTATVTVSMNVSPPAVSTETVVFSVSGDAAQYDIPGLPADATTGTVTVVTDADGVGTAPIELFIIDDAIPEETITALSVTLQVPEGFAVPAMGNTSTAVRIRDDDEIRVGFEESTYREREDVGQFEVCVVVTVPPQSTALNRQFSLSVSTRAGSSGSTDYTAISNQIVGPFSNLRRRECFSVEVANDQVAENSENFFLDMAPAPGVVLERVRITRSQAMVTLIDNDPIVLGWTQESVDVVARESSGMATLTVAISSPAAVDREDLYLWVDTMDDMATATVNAIVGTDYTGLSRHRVGPFGANNRSHPVTIALTEDAVPEVTSKHFTAALRFIPGRPVPPNTRIEPANAMVTIQDDDIIRVGFEQTTYREREDIGQFEACVVVTMPPQSTDMNRQFNLSVSTRAGTAGSADYTAISNQIVGPFGNLRRRECFSVEITEDAVAENDETYFLDLGPAPGVVLERVTITPSQATVTIEDDDVIVVGWRESARVNVEERVGATSFDAIIHSPATIERSFYLQVRGTDDLPIGTPIPGIGSSVWATATAGEDYRFASERIGPFSQSARTVEVMIDLADDVFEAPQEWAGLVLGFVQGESAPPRINTTPTTTYLVIIEDDRTRVGFEQTRYRVKEEAGALEACVVITAPDASGVLERTLSVSVSSRAGTATTGTDYTAVDQTLGPFNNSNRRHCVNVGIPDDAVSEGEKDFHLDMAVVEDTPIALLRLDTVPDTVTITIRQSDRPTEVTVVADETVVEEGATVAFTVTVTNSTPMQMVEVPFTVIGDAADYDIVMPSGLNAASTMGTLTLAVGADGVATGTVALSITDDNDSEGRELLVVSPAAPTGGFLADENTTAGVTIRQSDREKEVSITTGQTDVDEGTTATFTVMLVRGGTTGEVVVPFAVTGDAADYDIVAPAGVAADATTGTLALSVGSDGVATGIVALLITDDTDVEGRELLVVSPGAPAGGFLADENTSASVTITRSDLSIVVGFEETTYREREDVGQFEVCVLMGPDPGAVPLTSGLLTDAVVTLRVSAVADSATLATGDYTAISNQPVGPFRYPGRRRECFAVEVANDGVAENSENFFLDLSIASAENVEGIVVSLGNERATVTVIDNDPVVIGWAPESRVAVARESSGSVTLTIAVIGPETIERDDFDVGLSTVAGSAAAGADYTSFSNQRIGPFGANNRSRPVTINLVDNTVPESSAETFTARLGFVPGEPVPPNTVLNPANATVTIQDDDPVGVGWAPASRVVLAEESTGSVTLTIAISMPPTIERDDIFVQVSTVPGSAGAADYTPLSNRRIGPFSQANRSLPVTIALTDDNLFEDLPHETFTAVLSVPAGEPNLLITSATAVISIEDNDRDDEPPVLRAAAFDSGQSRVWLFADENIAIVRPSDMTELPTTEVRGFRLTGGQNADAVTVTSALYRAPAGIVLELTRELTAQDNAVSVSYQYPRGDAPGIFDRALREGRNTRNNQITMPLTIMVSRDVRADRDNDGIPDATEARLGANPLTPLSLSRQPAFAIRPARQGSAGNPAYIAYSGIREFGVREHLGVASVASTNTMQASAVNLQAYYLEDTFGYDFDGSSYGCSARFPANYAAPLSQGGCGIVDWGNVIAGVEHRIGWLAMGADGLWTVDTGTASNLPQQFIYRIPELNMDAERLFTTGANVVVSASFDSAPSSTLTLDLLQMPVGSTTAGMAETVTGAGTPQTFSIRTARTATWRITGLRDGSVSRLWSPSTSVHPQSTEVSLGLLRETEVAGTGGAPVPLVLGRARLTRGSANGDVGVLEAGATGYTLAIPVENSEAGTTGAPQSSVTDRSGVLDNVRLTASTGEYRVMFDVTAMTMVTTATAEIAVVAATIHGAETMAVYRYPVVASNTPAAQPRADSDRDGIPDEADDYEDTEHLPVVVDEGGDVSGWHHIRPVLATHDLSLGDATRERIATATQTMLNNYVSYAASQSTGVGTLAVVYDFAISGVDYASVDAGSGATGGDAGVIIPLPRSLYDAPSVRLEKYPSGRAFSTAGDNDYGFAPLEEGGACPDDTMVAGSPYRDNAGALRRTKRAGDACLVVYIVDGGANDEDGVANGIIKDPLGVGIGSVVGGVRHGGGSFGLPALGVLLLLLLLAHRCGNPLRLRSDRRR